MLGIWIEQTEGAKFWLRVMNELRNRGVADILIAVVDGLKGFPGGTLVPFSRGTAQSGLIQVGGDGAQAFSSLSAGIETQNYFTHAEFDVTPSLTIFGQAALGLSKTEYNQIQQFNLGGFNGFTIFSGNAFLNPAVQQVLTQTNTPAFAMGRVNFDFGTPD